LCTSIAHNVHEILIDSRGHFLFLRQIIDSCWGCGLLLSFLDTFLLTSALVRVLTFLNHRQCLLLNLEKLGSNPLFQKLSARLGYLI